MVPRMLGFYVSLLPLGFSVFGRPFSFCQPLLLPLQVIDNHLIPVDTRHGILSFVLGVRIALIVILIPCCLSVAHHDSRNKYQNAKM
jgi:hypothetical protein